ncbi:MAG: flagellar biosynthesis protein FlhA, partial [Myxococcales bacterium]
GGIAEVILPFAIILIVLMMVVPVPPFLLDSLLAVSLALAVGVFLIAMFIEDPLDYSVFPIVVLVATLLRLSLNVSSTRLILLHGAEGQGSAGRIIETFGRFVIGGDLLVGLVVFLILVVINFVVIVKGSGRVAEVAARFTLDGMPGKQMAIDQDLNSGAITAEVAQKKRDELERESDFYGAMDGASKFVHGDAVAGLMITFVNLIGGLLRGLLYGMDISKAIETFSILSVGDALVAQVPALLMSTASGLFVTRTATEGQVGRALASQLLSSRRAVGMTAGILTLFALIPGMPALPFLGLAGVLGYAAYTTKEKTPEEKAAAASGSTAPGGGPAAPPTPGKTEEIEASLPLDMLSLDVGYELIPAVDVAAGGTLLERIGSMRKQFAIDLGIIVPPVRIRDNLQLEPCSYQYSLLGTEIAKGRLRSGQLLAMNPAGVEVDGDDGADPVFGTPAKWISPRDRELAEALQCTVVDNATVMATHLGELVRTHADQLLGRPELQQLFEVFGRSHPKLVEDLVPSLLTIGDVLKVCRNLLREGVSIRDLRTILEALSDTAPATKDTEQLTEITRQRLFRQITSAYKDTQDGVLYVIVLDQQVEEMFRRSLRDLAQGAGGALDPEEVRRLGVSLENAAQRQRQAGHVPILLTSPDLRRYVRAFVERRAPTVPVLSFREIDPQCTIRPVDTLSTRGIG